MKFKTALYCFAATAMVAGVTPANAITINLNDIGGVTGSKAELGFKIAAAYWSRTLTGNAVINLNVGFSDLGPNILGSTGSSLITYVPIADYYAALAANGTSKLDSIAVGNLAPLSANGSVSALIPGYVNPATQDGIDVGTSRLTPDGTAIAQTIALTTANAKALGLTSGGVDGQVQFSNTFNFDFNPLDGISAGSYDFVGVAVHEIGHALGFVSAADDFDYSDGATGFNPDDYWWGYGLDMFRYSADGLDWRPNQDSYFSIDGGATAFMDGLFSTGTYTGDGWQASHWKEPAAQGCSDFRGIMNPYICGGLTDSTTALDLALFDAIGWNVNVDVLTNPNYNFTTADMTRSFFAVPEPTTWAMLISGFGMIGAAVRRRRTKIAFA
jgi:hypothetical protein